MTNPKAEDNKVKFKAALERKNSNSNTVVKKQEVDGSSKLHASSGNKPKLFRRKSG